MIAIGYGCAAFKFFVPRDVNAIRKILNYVCIPGMVFRQIGIMSFKLSMFFPLLIGVLSQILIQAILALISFIVPATSKSKKYISYIYAGSYADIIFSGLPIVEFLFGSEYVYVPIMLAMAQFLFLEPIHKIVVFKLAGPGHDLIEDSEIENENENEPNEIELEETAVKAITDIETNSAEPKVCNIKDDIKEPLRSEETDEKIHGEGQDSKKVGILERMKAKTLANTIIFSFITPINVCFVLGIIWSATGWTMMKFLNSFVNDLEKAVVAAGLFTCGVFMWENPFFSFHIIEVPLFIVFHIVVFPLIGALWAWVLGFDNTIIRAVIFCYSAPSALSSYASAIEHGLSLSTPTFVFLWTNLILLPVYILWTVVFNQANFFPTD